MLNKVISDTLRILGMPSHIKGYPYVRDAIIMAVKDSNCLDQITSVLYPEIAKKHATTAQRVERAIRHAVELTWDRGDLDVLQSYFGYTVSNNKGKPTNSQFIATMYDHISTINFSNTEVKPSYRPCKAGSRDAYFHAWYTFGTTCEAIVEYTDGCVAKVPLSLLRFIDPPQLNAGASNG